MFNTRKTDVKRPWITIICLLCVVAGAAPARAQEASQNREAAPQAERLPAQEIKMHRIRIEGFFEGGTKAVKYCEGKFKKTGGNPAETIISVECTNVSDSCDCAKTSVTCGASKSAPGGYTFVDDSCKTTIVSVSSE